MAQQRVTRLRAVIRGQVQGVGFRYWTERVTLHFAITGGYVQNQSDGTVEVIAESAERGPLEALLRALYQGPTSARVENIETAWEENVEPRFVSFRIRDI